MQTLIDTSIVLIQPDIQALIDTSIV